VTVVKENARCGREDGKALKRGFPKPSVCQITWPYFLMFSLQKLHPSTQRRLSASRIFCSARGVCTASSKLASSPSLSRLAYLAGFGAAGLSLAAYCFIPSKSRSAPTYNTRPLSPFYFTPLALTSSENSGPDTKLLTFTVPPHLLPPPVSYDLIPIWSVYIKDDDIQVERPYTPLEGINEDGRMVFWIKKYEKGEVGRWLHSKSVGDTVEIRGPLKTWIWQEGAWDEVVMVRVSPFFSLTIISHLQGIGWDGHHAILSTIEQYFHSRVL
jgi:cytochrome-b5 reductase